LDEHKELNRRQFGAHADDYVNSADHALGRSLGRLVELVKPQHHWVLLDVSTGGGHTALAFSPYVARVVATDLAPEMLVAAERFVSERGAPNVEFKTADAESLPFGNAEFDLVTNRIALHHYPDARKAISEMARVLRPGGILGLVDNVVPPDKQIAGYINGFEKLHDPSHHWCYPLVRLQAYVKAAGLTVEHSETFKKERDLDAWADRSGCSEETKEKLRALLREAPEGPRLFLNPRVEGTRFAFSLEEAVLIARK
jgi:ubiquinone/menaquinone biosynthesis C-methylase UbiE